MVEFNVFIIISNLIFIIFLFTGSLKKEKGKRRRKDFWDGVKVEYPVLYLPWAVTG